MQDAYGLSSTGQVHWIAQAAAGPQGPLSWDQRRMADIIVQAFEAKGHPPELAAAAVVNAWAESRLDPIAWGDKKHDPEGKGCSGGLFQLNRCGGAGMGMSRAAVEDPYQNVQRVLSEIAGYFGRPLRAALQRGERSIPELAALFTLTIMRPEAAEKKALERAAMARVMFPLPLHPPAAPSVVYGWVEATSPPARARGLNPWTGALALTLGIGLVGVAFRVQDL